jgi:hypothetical protein
VNVCEAALDEPKLSAASEADSGAGVGDGLGNGTGVGDAVGTGVGEGPGFGADEPPPPPQLARSTVTRKRGSLVRNLTSSRTRQISRRRTA